MRPCGTLARMPEPSTDFKRVKLHPLTLRQMAWELADRASRLSPTSNERFALSERAKQLAFAADERLELHATSVWAEDLTWCGSNVPRGDRIAKADPVKIVRTNEPGVFEPSVLFDHVIETPRNRIDRSKIPPRRSCDVTQERNPHAEPSPSVAT